MPSYRARRKIQVISANNQHCALFPSPKSIRHNHKLKFKKANVKVWEQAIHVQPTASIQFLGDKCIQTGWYRLIFVRNTYSQRPTKPKD